MTPKFAQLSLPLPLALAAALALTGFATSARAEPDAGRFALLVGANLGDHNDPVLHHAEDDATRLAHTLRLMGEFPADQVVLMTGPTAPEVRDALIRINARVREQSNGVLIVFYSGHADERALHLSGTRLPTAELKGLLVGSPAASRLLIVDACRSGSLVQMKGAHPAPTFVVPVLPDPAPEGFAVLTSSAASEDSQESAALGSSYFTYYVNSGLIGAADQDHDGAVTLSELFAFASSETRAATAGSLAGPQNPTFQFALGGRRDLVLTRLLRRDQRLGTLRFSHPGRYLVQRRDVAGLSPPVAEIAARDGGSSELAFPPGSYRVTLRGDRDVSERDVVIAGGEVTEIELAQMIRIDVGRNVRKGGPRRSATGVAVTAGWHTAELGGTLALGAGPDVMVSLRHDRRWFSAEARVGLDRGTLTDARGVMFDNRGITPSLLVLLPFDWSAVTLAAGLEVGVVLMHQGLGVDAQSAPVLAAPVTPALLHDHWSTGLEGGVVTQLDSPLGTHGYLRLEAGVFARSFGGDASTAPDRRGARVRFLAGVGTAF